MLHEQLIEKKRLQGQLEVARQVQWNCCRRARSRATGFDMTPTTFPPRRSPRHYDWVRIYDDQIGIVIADVSGKAFRRRY